MTIDHARIKALFQAAIDREDPVERLEFLDREIGDNTDLRGRLDLLSAHLQLNILEFPVSVSVPVWIRSDLVGPGHAQEPQDPPLESG